MKQLTMLDDRPLPMLVQRACQLLKAHEPAEGYFGCFSGGKDSITIKELARMAGVKVTWHYHVTTIDPPELIRFIKRHHADVVWDKPRENFFQRMARLKGFPTRRNRWCCDEYKEKLGPKGCSKILGVRIAESSARKARWTQCVMDQPAKRHAVLPIRLWSDEQVWAFIRTTGIAYCELYDQGFTRLGCVGCPMAREAGRRHEFQRWPGFEKSWRWAFKRIWARRTGTTQRDGRPWFGDVYFKGHNEMFEWWLSNKSLPEKINQETSNVVCNCEKETTP